MLTTQQQLSSTPFAPQSTFECGAFKIPRWLFYGGCFYAPEPYVLPCHVSVIHPYMHLEKPWWKDRQNNVVNLFCGLDIADATGKTLATLYIPETGNTCPIQSVNFGYNGCFKMRLENFNQIAVAGTSGEEISTLRIFVNALRQGKDVKLDPDSLILAPEICSFIRRPEKHTNEVKVIDYGTSIASYNCAENPSLFTLLLKPTNAAAAASVASTTDDRPTLKRLVIRGRGSLATARYGSSAVASTEAGLIGPHVTISPGYFWEDPTINVDPNNTTIQDQTAQPSRDPDAQNDIVIVGQGNRLIISTRRNYMEGR